MKMSKVTQSKFTVGQDVVWNAKHVGLRYRCTVSDIRGLRVQVDVPFENPYTGVPYHDFKWVPEGHLSLPRTREEVMEQYAASARRPGKGAGK